MSLNPLARLRKILPDSPVLVGLVTAHDLVNDTSTVQLPGADQTGYGDSLQAGAIINARGTTVAVGDNAFVRDGVIETRAPSGTPVSIVVGKVIQAADPLVFSGPIPDQFMDVGDPFSVSLAPYWSGGYGSIVYLVFDGSPPPGISMNAFSGVLGGVATFDGLYPNVVARAVDETGFTSDSNPFDLTCTFDSSVYLVDAPFDVASDFDNLGTLGGTFALNTAAPLIDPDFKLVGTGSLELPPFGTPSPFSSRPHVILSVDGLGIADDSVARTVRCKMFMEMNCSGACLVYRDSHAGAGGDPLKSYIITFASNSPDSLQMLSQVDAVTAPLATSVPTGEWFEIMISRDAENMVRFFYNGTKITETPVTASTRVNGFGSLLLVGTYLTGGTTGSGGGTVHFDQVQLIQGYAQLDDYTVV